MLPHPENAQAAADLHRRDLLADAAREHRSDVLREAGPHPLALLRRWLASGAAALRGRRRAADPAHGAPGLPLATSDPT